MNQEIRLRRLLLIMPLFMAVMVSVLISSITLLVLLQRGEPVDLIRSLQNSMRWMTWGVLAVPLVVASWRAPIDGWRGWVAGALALLFAAGIAFGSEVLVRSKFALCECSIFYQAGQQYTLLRSSLNDGFALKLTLGIAVILITKAGYFHARYRAEEVRAAELQEALHRLKLDVLRSHLEPHFLFNALNSAVALIHRDRSAASRMLQGITALLRRSVQGIGSQEVSLREELEFVQDFLRVQRFRFPHQLEIEYDIDPALLAHPIPSLIIQPLVENSIRHGMRSAAPLRIRVAARRQNGRVQIEVADDGRGPSRELIAEGLGLRTVMKRVQQLYGSDGYVGWKQLSSRGFAVTLEIPVFG